MYSALIVNTQEIITCKTLKELYYLIHHTCREISRTITEEWIKVYFIGIDLEISFWTSLETETTYYGRNRYIGRREQ